MLKTSFVPLLASAALSLLPLSAQAVANTFIQFTDAGGAVLKGPSVSKEHPGWSEVNSWSWLVSAESSFVKGSGAAVGKPQPGPFSWSQTLDQTYPKLFTQLVKGQSSKTVTLDVAKSFSDRAPESFFSMVFGDVFYTRLAVGGGSDALINLNGEFVFRQVSMSYRPADATGRLGPAVTASWNVSTNVAGQSFYEFSGDPMALVGLSEALTLAVPEPQTWLLMLGGLSGLGFMGTRRKTRALPVLESRWARP